MTKAMFFKAQIKGANTGDLFSQPVNVKGYVRNGHTVAAHTEVRQVRHEAPPAPKPKSRLEELKQISASIDREMAELGKMSAKIALTGTHAEGAEHDARLDRLEAQRAKVRAEIKQLEPPPEKERVFQSDIDNAAAAARWKVMQERQIAGLTVKPKSKPIPIIKRPAA